MCASENDKKLKNRTWCKGVKKTSRCKSICDIRMKHDGTKEVLLCKNYFYKISNFILMENKHTCYICST